MAMFNCCQCLRATPVIEEGDSRHNSNFPCAPWAPSRESDNHQEANGQDSPPGPMLPLPSNLLAPFSHQSMEPMLVSDGRTTPFLGISPRPDVRYALPQQLNPLLTSPRIQGRMRVGSGSPERRARSSMQAQQLVRNLVQPNPGTTAAVSPPGGLIRRITQFGPPVVTPQSLQTSGRAGSLSPSMRDVSPPAVSQNTISQLLQQTSLTSLPIERRELPRQTSPFRTPAISASIVKPPPLHELERADKARQFFQGMISPVVVDTNSSKMMAVDQVQPTVIKGNVMAFPEVADANLFKLKYSEQAQPTSIVVTTPPISAVPNILNSMELMTRPPVDASVKPSSVELNFTTSDQSISFGAHAIQNSYDLCLPNAQRHVAPPMQLEVCICGATFPVDCSKFCRQCGTKRPEPLQALPR